MSRSAEIRLEMRRQRLEKEKMMKIATGEMDDISQHVEKQGEVPLCVPSNDARPSRAALPSRAPARV